MSGPKTESPAAAPQRAGGVAVVYADDYVNKLNGQRLERECRLRLDQGCRALVINFRDTQFVNSIGVSLLLGVIDDAAERGAPVVFSNLSRHHVELFELLGLTRHVAMAESEEAALDTLAGFRAAAPPPGH